MLDVNLHALVNSLGELLDIFNLLSILLIDFSNNFEGSMWLTEDFENLFPSTAANSILSLDFHAIIGSFCALNMKVYLAVSFGAFNDCSYLRPFFAANNTTNIKFSKIEFVHLDWSSRSH